MFPTKERFIGHSPCYTPIIKERSASHGKEQEHFRHDHRFSALYGREPFQIGNLIRCAKEPSNPYDSDAIRAFLPYIGKVGYIANSPQTKAGGTESASRIYERVPKRFYVRVLFTTCTKIICRVEFGDMSDLNAELESQTEDKWDNWDDEDDEIQF